jgi:hypothetical protein
MELDESNAWSTKTLIRLSLLCDDRDERRHQTAAARSSFGFVWIFW